MAFGQKPSATPKSTPAPKPVPPARATELARRKASAGGVSVTTAGQAPIEPGSTTPTYSHLTPGA